MKRRGFNPISLLRPTTQSLDLLEWTVKYRAMLIPDRPFNLSRYPYLRGIYTCPAQQVVIDKAGQMGASEYLISYALHATDQRQATALYVFPTEGHVSDFSSARIGPAIEASPYLTGLVIDAAKREGQRGADRVRLKRIGSRFLYLRGGVVAPDGSAPQLKSIDADVLVLDELDEMDARAPAIAEKRLGASAIAEQRKVSTPTYAGVGIHAEFLKSDQRLWHVACSHCGRAQSLSIDQVVLEWDHLDRPAKWRTSKLYPGDAAILCKRCHRELDRLAAGEWIAMQPDNPIAGFHMTKLFSPNVKLLDIINALQTVDETRRKETVNQDLAEPYAPRGGQLTDAMLDSTRREYGHGSTRNPSIMGVDVGAALHVIIREKSPDPETGERRQLYAGATTWSEIGRLMVNYRVAHCIIDALPETTKAREFQADFRDIVWLAYYALQRTGTKETDYFEWIPEKGIVNLDRTRAIDKMFSQVLLGVNTLPANARDVPDYYAHLKAPVRTLTTGSDGIQTARYIESGPDHFAHAETYCTVAAESPPAIPSNRAASTAPRIVKAESIFR